MVDCRLDLWLAAPADHDQLSGQCRISGLYALPVYWSAVCWLVLYAYCARNLPNYHLAKTGGIASNGSGDYVIAMSTAKDNLIPNHSESLFNNKKELRNNDMSPLFLATIEATEEAILNSLFAAKTMIGRDNHTIESIPIAKVIEIMKKYNKIVKN